MTLYRFRMRGKKYRRSLWHIYCFFKRSTLQSIILYNYLRLKSVFSFSSIATIHKKYIIIFKPNLPNKTQH